MKYVGHLLKYKMCNISSFHAINIGHLSKRASEPAFIPCTPKGVIELIKSTGVAMSGKKAVVVGRSDIVVSSLFAPIACHFGV